MSKKTTVLDFQVIIFPEDGSYSAIAPEINIATQGDTIEEARANLKEALELRMESLSMDELAKIKLKLGQKIVATKLDIAVSV